MSVQCHASKPRLGYHVSMLATDIIERSTAAGVRISHHLGTVTLTLDRPGGNRVSHAVLLRLREVFQQLSATAHLRVVVLRAEGPDFSFGADLGDPAMAENIAGGRESRMALAALGQATLDAWARLPVPTVAAARGRIVGAGACFFCTADFAFASADASVLFPEVDRGMHLSWGVLPRLVGRFGVASALRLALTGSPVACGELRPTIAIADDPASAAESLAGLLAAKPPLAVRAIKQVVSAAAERLQETAANDPALFADTVGSEDFAEAMAAFFEKRPGKYSGS